jgi:cytochrome b involved in lipid metabolism
METKFYSLEEVAKNDGKGGNRTWIVVKDSVYDVTDYLQQEEVISSGETN